ncbi:hypothetical protein AF435_14570 [Listeria monocytogenes]|uniref:HNH endonuclease n=1 Tax=Listeria monocytogenes TaxID=1639 RepID=A0AAN2WHW5_LISMN|nr:hypothetical protein [Listeria monocytogenes]EAC3367824.1 hypothetical protein [Listeria monocytogenes]EAC7086925.1 hypothetical protein [Listeria monocytogenes]EAC8542079.1 hypothetical protein [Listeria monocytogenes]EAC8548081.1 hypothetical protein [Listeria monocytogenes]
MSKYGICMLCSKKKKLTFEHIPPKATGNTRPVKMHTLDHILERKEKSLEVSKYIQSQKGLGAYTLCEECNNNTGSWYGVEFSDFSNTIGYMIEKEGLPKEQANVIFEMELNPLKVIKQIISFFCSTSSLDFIDQSLRNFVLDKNSMEFPENYLLKGYINNGDTTKISKDLHFVLKEKSGIVLTPLSEICFYPLGFVLYKKPFFKGFDHLHTDISDFSHFHEKKMYKISMSILQSTGDLPFVYNGFEWGIK